VSALFSYSLQLTAHRSLLTFFLSVLARGPTRAYIYVQHKFCNILEQFSMKTILVVDDDEPIRLLLSEELSDAGYHVLTATNARDALKMVEEEVLDLVILDIRMPGMDGLEALPRILGLKEGLPVILNTAYTQYQESFMSWAADAYVVKSSDLTELKAKVKELIKE
jgi:two-component system response regulator (stage 0 sporulation protein F)